MRTRRSSRTARDGLAGVHRARLPWHPRDLGAETALEALADARSPALTAHVTTLLSSPDAERRALAATVAGSAGLLESPLRRHLARAAGRGRPSFGSAVCRRRKIFARVWPIGPQIESTSLNSQRDMSTRGRTHRSHRKIPVARGPDAQRNSACETTSTSSNGLASRQSTTDPAPRPLIGERWRARQPQNISRREATSSMAILDSVFPVTASRNSGRARL